MNTPAKPQNNDTKTRNGWPSTREWIAWCTAATMFIMFMFSMFGDRERFAVTMERLANNTAANRELIAQNTKALERIISCTTEFASVKTEILSMKESIVRLERKIDRIENGG